MIFQFLSLLFAGDFIPLPRTGFLAVSPPIEEDNPYVSALLSVYHVIEQAASSTKGN